MKNTTPKLWLLAALAASALSLSACADKEKPLDEPEAMDTIDDAQTPVEQEATGVDDVEQVAEGVNSADTSDDPLVNDNVAIATADDDVAIATADDSEVLDGSESEEHISTY